VTDERHDEMDPVSAFSFLIRDRRAAFYRAACNKTTIGILPPRIEKLLAGRSGSGSVKVLGF